MQKHWMLQQNPFPLGNAGQEGCGQLGVLLPGGPGAQGRASSHRQWGGSSAIRSRTAVGTFAPWRSGVSEVTQLPFGLFYLPHLFLPSFLVLFATAYASRSLLVSRNQPRGASSSLLT